jgi:hypothetical protein
MPKKYKFQVGTTDVVGSQTFEVEASSPEEALKKIRAGEGEIVATDLEVQSLDWHDATLVNEE